MLDEFQLLRDTVARLVATVRHLIAEAEAKAAEELAKINPVTMVERAALAPIREELESLIAALKPAPEVIDLPHLPSSGLSPTL